jgi:hypothetical protein
MRPLHVLTLGGVGIPELALLYLIRELLIHIQLKERLNKVHLEFEGHEFIVKDVDRASS